MSDSKPNLLMPPIEFRVRGYVPNENAYAFVRNIMQPAMHDLELGSEDVRQVIIADNDHYGPAIKEFASKDGFTDDSVYQGIGKSLPNFDEKGYAGSCLVLHYCVLASSTRQGGSGSVGEADAMSYCLFHELGHCVDYRRRPAQQFQAHAFDTTSIILGCADANSRTLLAEYAACFFSAKFMTPPAFQYIADQTARCSTDYLVDLGEKRDLYRRGLLSLHEVRDAALAAFWRALIEFAKLMAFVHGNSSISQNGGVNLIWPGENQAATQALQSLETGLKSCWKGYPDCIEGFRRAAEESWFAVAEAEGYRFEIKPEGDYLWFV